MQLLLLHEIWLWHCRIEQFAACNAMTLTSKRSMARIKGVCGRALRHTHRVGSGGGGFFLHICTVDPFSRSATMPSSHLPLSTGLDSFCLPRSKVPVTCAHAQQLTRNSSRTCLGGAS